MTRKPLPKAITRSLEDVHAIAGGVAADAELAPGYAAHFDAVEPEPAHSMRPRAAMAPAHEAVKAPRPAPSAEAQAFAARRLSLAKKVVERHKLYAAMSGLSPISVVNVTGVTAMIVRMVKQLSEIYQVPFQRDRARAAILGLMGGAVPMGLGATTAATLAFVVPGAGLVGLGVCAMSAGALTRGIGLVFIDSFENGIVPGADSQDAQIRKPR